MKRSPSTHPGESGQALVESALVIPVMVFLILGILQLGTLHHARLMTEYAAYRAARAGIVNSGDCEIMKKAAYVALLPTLGPPKSGGKGRVDTLINVALVHDAYTDEKLEDQNQRYQEVNLERVRVEVLNPRRSQLPTLFSSYGSHLSGLEVDFDDIRNAQVIEANLLTVRITYFYEMRIPFANWQLHAFYMGREALNGLAMRGVNFTTQKVNGGSLTDHLEDQGTGKSKDHKKIRTLAESNVFAIPVVSTYSMRMQSNFLNGAHGPTSCAVDG
ncbi:MULTISPECIES: TadE family protein [unclassified Corallococcus]|uniref:TadE family protein n=1 Tax=unclassified Corallococcus TaxID=2685029 RepID=UPI001A8E89FC|nr:MULTISPECIES: TadE family protein [unclassified Corallococcus]MBN9686461.1 pilus assembly protein [Corallococcus sp. NCSPR001]WAS82111.1 pilus assembly protein [Corallococcus sp. NCRR]